MFIAMNNFKVVSGREEDFERGWRERESHLDTVPGFLAFHLLKGDQPGEYVSHTMWESRDAFMGWAQSEAFRKAHGGSMPEGIIEGHPFARFYESVLEQGAGASGYTAG